MQDQCDPGDLHDGLEPDAEEVGRRGLGVPVPPQDGRKGEERKAGRKHILPDEWPQADFKGVERQLGLRKVRLSREALRRHDDQRRHGIDHDRVEDFVLVDNDTSPSGEKDFILYNPFKNYRRNKSNNFDAPSVHIETEYYSWIKIMYNRCFICRFTFFNIFRIIFFNY